MTKCIQNCRNIWNSLLRRPKRILKEKKLWWCGLVPRALQYGPGKGFFKHSDVTLRSLDCCELTRWANISFPRRTFPHLVSLTQSGQTTGVHSKNHAYMQSAGEIHSSLVVKQAVRIATTLPEKVCILKRKKYRIHSGTKLLQNNVNS
jgi:hypothetical protein